MLGVCGMLFVSHQRGVPIRLMLALAITDDSDFRSGVPLSLVIPLSCGVGTRSNPREPAGTSSCQRYHLSLC